MDNNKPIIPNKPKLPNKIIKTSNTKGTMFKIFLVILVLFLFNFSLIVITYFVPPMKNRPSFVDYCFNSVCLFIRPSEAMWSCSHYYYDYSSDNHWDGYSSTALFWLRMSAIFGGAPSQAELGGYYYFKKNDLKNAIYWMEKAAKQTNEDNKYDDYKGKLALLYCQEGEYQNEKRALQLYKESAALGSKKSAEMYLLLFRKLYPGELPEELNKK